MGALLPALSASQGLAALITANWALRNRGHLNTVAGALLSSVFCGRCSVRHSILEANSPDCIPCSHTYQKAVLFVDNSGADILLGGPTPPAC